MRYKFFSKNSKSEDAISKVNASSIEQAYTYFAAIKKMEVDKFKKLFVVKEI
tara:strand:+ start:236 stop:391 length:156 start_codon:yes stop_codon:yes gene_type:complete